MQDTKTMNLTSALAYVSGAVFAATAADGETSQTTGYRLFTDHLTDSKVLLLAAVNGTDPTITYDMVLRNFKVLTTSISSPMAQFARLVVQILEAGEVR